MNPNNMLSKDQIQKASDIVTETVDVPEWDGSIRVRGLTGAERDEYEASLVEERKKGLGLQATKNSLRHARAKLVVMAAVDESGGRFFEDEDIPWLSQKSARALDRVAAKARELSGLTEEDEEELLGNSGGALGASSPSISPEPSAKPTPSS